MGIYCLFDTFLFRQTINMKIVAVFLACIVASQAASFNIPNYDYWCRQNFCVVPHQSYYNYRVNFNRAWCQGHFYRGILCEFPKCLTPKGCEAEDQSDVRLKEIEGRLLKVRQQIYTELMHPQQGWIKMLYELNYQYVCVFRDYYRHATGCAYTELEGRSGRYAAELEGYRRQAVARYNEHVHQIMARIEQYHRQIVQQFKECVEKRKHQVGGVHGKMNERAEKYIKSYKEKLEQLRSKKSRYVRLIFSKLYAGKSIPSEFEEVMRQWEEEMVRYDQTLVQAFHTKVMDAVQMVEKNYRCTYVCYFRNGCYSISRKYSACDHLPSVPKCAMNLHFVGAFSADWNGCSYKTLKTCSKEEQESGGEFHYEKYIEKVHKKCEAYTKELEFKNKSWKKQVEEWCVYAMRGLEEIIVCRIPQGYNGCPPTEAEVINYHNALRVQAKEWLHYHRQGMLHQISTVHERVHVRISQWKAHSEQYVHKLKANFHECMSGRQGKIDAYIKAVAEKRVHKREALIKTLTTKARFHLCSFDKFFYSVFGKDTTNQMALDLRKHYVNCVDVKVKGIIEKFDHFQHYYEPRLITHYLCCHKCSVNFCVPSFRLMCKWNFCPPSIQSCQFRC